MGIVSVPSFGADPVSVTGPTLDAKVDGLATEFNGSIENVNIKTGAAIANAKLNLANITQDVTLAGTTVISGTNTISGNTTHSGTVALNGVVTVGSKIVKLAKGADVASAAGAITLGDDGNYFDITGTEAITSITAKTAGTVVVLQFDSTATLTDGGNLKLNSNFTGAAEAQIMLVSDGTNWLEVSRSTSSQTFASAAEVKTGTESAKSVAPSTMVAHEGVIKGWIRFDGSSGSIGTGADSFNVSGVTDNGTGDYTIAWDTDFGNANYVITGICKRSDTTVVVVHPTTLATGSARILTTGASPVDAETICVMAIGDR